MYKPRRTLSFQRIFFVLGLALLSASVMLLALRGAIVMGAALAVAGLLAAFLASRISSQGPAAGHHETCGPLTKITTQYLDVDVDTQSKVMKGFIRKGLFEGQRIGVLHPAELALIWQDCRGDDPQSATLIEAHLDALYPQWRAAVRRGEEHFSSGPDGRMSLSEAYKILGLSSGADRDHVRKAHRDLMLKLHPDRGGSTYLSSKINEAKDVLLSNLDGET